MAQSLKPIISHHLGSVGVSVFSRERKTKDGQTFDSYSVSISKSYKNDKGEGVFTDSLDAYDLGSACILLNKAASEIIDLRKKKSENSKEGSKEDGNELPF